MAITYNRLGSNGRLGNQMFQYASFRGIAANRGFEWIIPPPDSESTCNYGLFECFNMFNVKPNNFGFSPNNFQTVDNGRFSSKSNLPLSRIKY